MNPLADPRYATLRHHELIAQRQTEGAAARLRRQAKARKLRRRSVTLANRAAALVERTSS